MRSFCSNIGPDSDHFPGIIAKLIEVQPKAKKRKNNRKKGRKSAKESESGPKITFNIHLDALQV